MHGFYKFQALVHQCGAVYAYFSSHTPVGMAQGLLRSYGGGFLTRKPSERSAGGCKNNTPQLFTAGAAPLQALKYGRMLGIHRYDFCSFLPGLFLNYAAGTNQGFLVGQGDTPALVNGRKGRTQANTAGYRRNHRIGPSDSGGLRQATYPCPYGNAGIRQGYAELFCRSFVPHGHKSGFQQPGLLLQQFYVVVRGKRPHINPKPAGHLHSLSAHGTCGP